MEGVCRERRKSSLQAEDEQGREESILWLSVLSWCRGEFEEPHNRDMRIL